MRSVWIAGTRAISSGVFRGAQAGVTEQGVVAASRIFRVATVLPRTVPRWCRKAPIGRGVQVSKVQLGRQFSGCP